MAIYVVDLTIFFHLWEIYAYYTMKCGKSVRHSHASHSLDRGAPIHLLQKTLGHSSVAITEMYLHARPTDSSGLYLPDDDE
ncbi:MAG: tyrosine-type recombinase/integrase [Nostoc sp.]